MPIRGPAIKRNRNARAASIFIILILLSPHHHHHDDGHDDLRHCPWWCSIQAVYSYAVLCQQQFGLRCSGARQKRQPSEKEARRDATRWERDKSKAGVNFAPLFHLGQVCQCQPATSQPTTLILLAIPKQHWQHSLCSAAAPPVPLVMCDLVWLDFNACCEQDRPRFLDGMCDRMCVCVTCRKCK